jgi:Tripartite tricarboxylate transporter TctB family
MPANFTLFFVAVFIGAIWWGWQWPYIAKMMPVYVAAIPGLALAILQLVRDGTGWEERRAKLPESIEMDETHDIKLDKRTELSRTLTFFAWYIGGAAGIWLLGIVITLPLLVCLYMLVEGREKILPTIIMTAGTYGLVWGLFEYTLEMRWPPGLLFGY